MGTSIDQKSKQQTQNTIESKIGGKGATIGSTMNPVEDPYAHLKARNVF